MFGAAQWAPALGRYTAQIREWDRWGLFLNRLGRAWSFLSLAPACLFVATALPALADGWSSANPGGIQMVAERPYQAAYGMGRVPRQAGLFTVTLHRGARSTLVLVSPLGDRQMTLGFFPRPQGVALGGTVPCEVADLQPKTPLVIDGVVLKNPILHPMGLPGRVLLSDGLHQNGIMFVLPGY